MRNETVGTIKCMKQDLYCLLYVDCRTDVTFLYLPLKKLGLCVYNIHVHIQSNSVVLSFTCVTLDGKL